MSSITLNSIDMFMCEKEKQCIADKSTFACSVCSILHYNAKQRNYINYAFNTLLLRENITHMKKLNIKLKK